VRDSWSGCSYPNKPDECVGRGPGDRFTWAVGSVVAYCGSPCFSCASGPLLAVRDGQYQDLGTWFLNGRVAWYHHPEGRRQPQRQKKTHASRPVRQSRYTRASR